jgi:AmiR/NasT family two-component response regulator
VTAREITVDRIERWAPQREISAATALTIASTAEDRAAIEQAKDVLMAVYSIDAPGAFDLLSWGSQHTNTEVRVMAEQLLTGFRSLQ